MSRPDVNVVNVIGGLGNQLFQYMFGVALEEHTGLPTRFDVSDFDWYTLHGGLKIEEYFEVELSRATPAQVPFVARNALVKKVCAKVAPHLGGLSPIRSDGAYVLGGEDNTAGYFHGYWQSDDYGGAVVERMRRTLTFRPAVEDAAARAWAQLAPDPATSACVQIRRGDYATLPKTAPQYLLPLDYHRRAMDRMAAEEGITTFYVFSDDIPGVSRDLASSHRVVFIHPTISATAGTDLALMTRFSHHIISNSTFGWWAAALRRDEAGAVITPRPWLNPLVKGVEVLEPRLLPGWRILDV